MAELLNSHAKNGTCTNCDEEREAATELLRLHAENEALRAVLAKWGTPAPVGVEPVARLEIGKTKGGVSLTHIAEPAAFQLPEGMYALYIAPQPTQAQAVPLTQAQIIEAFCREPHVTQFVMAFNSGVRFAEQHHGIKGGQHGDE